MGYPQSPPYTSKEKPAMGGEIQLPSLSELFPRENPSPPYTPDYPYLSAPSSPGRCGSVRSYDLGSTPSSAKRLKAERFVECSGVCEIARPVLSPHLSNSVAPARFLSAAAGSSLTQPYLPPLRTAAPLREQGTHYRIRDETQAQDSFETFAHQQSHLAAGAQMHHSAAGSYSPHSHSSQGFCENAVIVDNSYYSYARRRQAEPETHGCERCLGYRSAHQPPSMCRHADRHVEAFHDRRITNYSNSQSSSKHDLPSCSRRAPYDEPSKGAYGVHKSHLLRGQADYSTRADYDGLESQGNFATSGVSGDSGKGRRRGNLPKEATSYLKEWFAANTAHPYPSEEEKARFAAETGLSPAQIGNWFINARRRHLPGLLNDQAHDKARRPPLQAYRSNHY